MKHCRIMYLRAYKNQAPVGCVALSFNRHNRTLTYQLSVLNPVDRFCRKTARHLALGRMVESPITISIGDNPSMHDISLAVMKDLAASKTAPSRAVKAAKDWLYWVSQVC